MAIARGFVWPIPYHFYIKRAFVVYGTHPVLLYYRQSNRFGAHKTVIGPQDSGQARTSAPHPPHPPE